MRQSFDTNILVRAAISRQGPAKRLLNLVTAAPEHTLVLSPYILNEVRGVLARPHLQRLSPQSTADIEQYVEFLTENAELVDPVVEYPVVLSDPKDDPVLFTAVRGQAEVLCTANVKHFGTPEVTAFCRQHGLRVMTDVELLRKLLS